jgi:two-component system, sensor histidine kinase and response regulator
MAQQKILLVDDQPDNIGVLFNLLDRQNYQVLIANDGELALSIAAESLPDLILLDVMMPGMNGFEVCQYLKANPATADTPVIFMTALAEIEDKLAGFSAGGADYITKPFQQEEVLARVKTHLTITCQRRELQEKNQELEKRNAELDAFSHTVAHDLKNPLNVINGYLQLLDFACEEGDFEGVHVNTRRARNAVSKASDIIESLLLLAGTSRHKQLLLEPFDMGYVINKVKERLELSLREGDVSLQEPPSWPFISGYPAWVEEIWVNYISNALKYGGKPPQIELGMDCDDPAHVRFWVRDNGPGLSAEEQARLFVPFTRLHTERAEGHGLGLCIVQRIAEKLGGNVGVDSTPGTGSTFYFTLPTEAKADEEDLNQLCAWGNDF